MEPCIRDSILVYLEEKLLIEFDNEIGDYTDLFQAGILDSFGYLQLISFLKETYAIEFSMEEMLTNVVASLTGLVGLVEAKLTT
jgi:D-alanine--poly(phosphoribitol) ligase subunit 2